ncbi:PAS domain S-box-containing protein [Geoalkalibacter ferrihydriticus]|uniref:Fis family transcriptional regulator n=2 Tax=Geoalkalibacter ferrihydriticus TaxID=392333 RepID=A0A0C2HW37_9BACT|nr:sigma 54-interacting transcriptional regulator [Geoalkalibacter ferrihydriticus]KIH76987.1 Fis family transcriptional regulator [Geoalkalibacter ferrihydriticus DSM 17813]SDL40719.1 PAS domain S-box-containing protein [Geoalkalibacter ferrihydriticus]
MAKNKERRPLTPAEDLRRLAEERARLKMAAITPSPSLADAQRLVHELEVHQIELEMQNAELLNTRDELEISRNKYSELFDFAPIGYFVLDAQTRIREINQAGAQMLEIERSLLTDKPFSRFIADDEERRKFTDHLKSVRREQGVHRCEIRIRKNDGTLFHGLLQSDAVTNSDCQEGCILISIMDVTDKWQLRMELQKAHDELESAVRERTAELIRSNAQLSLEIEEHKNARASLKGAYTQIKQLSEKLQEENIQLQMDLSRESNFGEIIGHSNAMQYVFFRIEQVAPQDATVLLLGETGTGKGLVARAIHNRSARKTRPMITVNCTALPGNLIESELFGREKGAFTGASARQMGRFELANGGTIFLDEIGEMPQDLQCKLLRVIQDGEFERLGSPHTIKVDVRIIAASNRNLEEEIRAGRFREDLFYRLNVFPITIPPLRQRKEDIPLLVNYFVAKYNKKIGKKIADVSKETLNTLAQYHWPGNVRELESVIERAIITSQGTTLRIQDRLTGLKKPEGEIDIKALADLERDHILKVLQKTNWRIEGEKGAAILLGLNASTLRARMRKFGLRRN